MKLTKEHAHIGLTAVAAIGVIAAALDAHHVRAALDDASAKRHDFSGEGHQVCPRAVSGWDRDVDLGVPKPCPNAADGMCLTLNNMTLTVQAWSARCQAGRL